LGAVVPKVFDRRTCTFPVFGSPWKGRNLGAHHARVYPQIFADLPIVEDNPK
jgi:hypothetical protein